ncbi:MAG: radical SAM protein, partial [Dehalococcoidia bacterium]|nr:radical SAM protein [Dehalococcoidia bacterium]
VRENGRLVLLKDGENISEVGWLPRPAYYDTLTTNNNKMVKIGQIGGADCLFFCYQNYCSHFSKDEQCLFCNLVSTSKTYHSVLRKKDIRDIGEVARAAFAEGNVKHILLTGGCFNHQKEIELVGEIIKSVREHTGLDRVPGTILPSPAKGGDEIKRYHDTGIRAIGFSMEIFDKKLYEAICPGKSNSTSHDEFLRSIGTAVKIFGEGNVYGVFVMGLEPRSTFLEGVRVITALGANVVPFVWSPNPGSKLEGHRAPSGEWFVDTVLEASEIVDSSGVPSGTENHCYRCDGNSLLHDALRLKGVE